MILNVILHCPACAGALNVPIGTSSTLFKTYEIFTNWTYSYGNSNEGKLNGNALNVLISRNFSRFSLFISTAYIYSFSQKMDMEDRISSLYGLDIGMKIYPIYEKFSKSKRILSLFSSFKTPIGFYKLNGNNQDIVSYLSFGIGYSFLYNKFINFSEAIYSKALKDDHIQSDKSRIILGSSYAFEKLQIGPIVNYLYQKALNSNEISLGIAFGFKVFNVFFDLNIHKSIYYQGEGIENDYTIETIIKGGL
jgi:hypothetical protein